MIYTYVCVTEREREREEEGGRTVREARYTQRSLEREDKR